MPFRLIGTRCVYLATRPGGSPQPEIYAVSEWKLGTIRGVCVSSSLATKHCALLVRMPVNMISLAESVSFSHISISLGSDR